jgi:hypothetical protein
MLVAKLRGARDRKRRQNGKCEGRKSYAEREGGPELIALARELKAAGLHVSLRDVAAALEDRGYVTPDCSALQRECREVRTVRMSGSIGCGGTEPSEASGHALPAIFEAVRGGTALPKSHNVGNFGDHGVSQSG